MSTSSPEGPLGRPVWSGSITFGLVSFPAKLYSATEGSTARGRAAPGRGPGHGHHGRLEGKGRGEEAGTPEGRLTQRD